MPRHSLNRTCLATGLLAVTMALSVWAQPPRKGNQTQSTLPSDQRLLKLHRTFIIDAEKLAIEYEREKDLDKTLPTSPIGSEQAEVDSQRRGECGQGNHHDRWRRGLAVHWLQCD